MPNHLEAATGPVSDGCTGGASGSALSFTCRPGCWQNAATFGRKIKSRKQNFHADPVFPISKHSSFLLDAYLETAVSCLRSFSRWMFLHRNAVPLSGMH